MGPRDQENRRGPEGGTQPGTSKPTSAREQLGFLSDVISVSQFVGSWLRVLLPGFGPVAAAAVVGGLAWFGITATQRDPGRLQPQPDSPTTATSVASTTTPPTGTPTAPTSAATAGDPYGFGPSSSTDPAGALPDSSPAGALPTAETPTTAGTTTPTTVPATAAASTRSPTPAPEGLTPPLDASAALDACNRLSAADHLRTVSISGRAYIVFWAPQQYDPGSLDQNRWKVYVSPQDVGGSNLPILLAGGPEAETLLLKWPGMGACGGGGEDVLNANGTDAANLLIGGEGADQLLGAGGSDILIGDQSDGRARLNAGDGDDWCSVTGSAPPPTTRPPQVDGQCEHIF